MNLAGIELENFYWQDQYKFKPVAQSKTRGANGSLNIQHLKLHYGQPVMLTGGWLKLGVIKQLIALESSPETKRVLTLNDGTEYSVLFDFEAGGVSPDPLFELSDPDDSTDYAVTIFLITVEPDPAPAQE